MRYINENYISESRNLDGEIMHISLHYDKQFNWAYDVVDDIAVNDPDRPAMVWCNPEGEEHRFSFGEMKFWSDKCANFLVSQGVRKGDMVMVILRRHYQFWICALALHKIGAVLVPATFMLREHDLEYRLKACSCKAIVCTDAGAIADVVDAVASGCPELQKKILVAGGGAGLAVSEPGFEPSRHRALSGPEHICELKTNREKTAFIQKMYHEIRTPLNIIGGFTQVLSVSIPDLPAEEIADITSRISESAADITRLAHDLDKAADLN